MHTIKLYCFIKNASNYNCLVGAAYQPGYFFFSDSLRSQAYEKVIPSSLHASSKD